jgi:predicted TIM-barrel fold metal-dependent hydrolase
MTAIRNGYVLPELISQYAGRINDMDAHEALPVSRWVDEFGSEAADLARAVSETPEGQASMIASASRTVDDTEINSETVFKVKLEDAPGAFDFKRRLEVMDFVGIDRQIMFPGGLGLFASFLYHTADDPKVMRKITGNRKAYAKLLIDRYNEWCARLYQGQSRLRPAAMLVEDNVDSMYATMKSLISKGVRLFQIPCDRPPGGMSPADPRMDKVWDMASAENVGLLAHIGQEPGFLSTMVWREAPAFKGWMIGAEFSLDPWTLSTIHLAVQNYLTTMVLGAVFERFPNLRFATAEFTGHWIGPFSENMDLWYAKSPFNSDIGSKPLKMKPSDYVRRNVRVACFDFEPVDKYIDRFGFEDVYCFATDFPHFEGGTRPLEKFAATMKDQKPAVVKKFFVDNAKLLLVD